MQAELHLRFYEELNDYLAPESRKREFSYRFGNTISVGQVLQDLEVPESEVELVLVNGLSVELACRLMPGDRVSFYPVFESLNVRSVLRIRDEPLRKLRFLVEPKLHRLASYLRRLGFETLVDARISDAEKEGQTLLTTNSALLKSGLSRVYVVREGKPGKQLTEVLSRFHLNTE